MRSFKSSPRSAAFAAAPHVRLHVIAHADHFFLEGLAEIGRIASEWLAKA